MRDKTTVTKRGKKIITFCGGLQSAKRDVHQVVLLRRTRKSLNRRKDDEPSGCVMGEMKRTRKGRIGECWLNREVFSTTDPHIGANLFCKIKFTKTIDRR